MNIKELGYVPSLFLPLHSSVYPDLLLSVFDQKLLNSQKYFNWWSLNQAFLFIKREDCHKSLPLRVTLVQRQSGQPLSKGCRSGYSTWIICQSALGKDPEPHIVVWVAPQSLSVCECMWDIWTFTISPKHQGKEVDKQYEWNHKKIAFQ